MAAGLQQADRIRTGFPCAAAWLLYEALQLDPKLEHAVAADGVRADAQATQASVTTIIPIGTESLGVLGCDTCLVHAASGSRASVGS